MGNHFRSCLAPGHFAVERAGSPSTPPPQYSGELARLLKLLHYVRPACVQVPTVPASRVRVSRGDSTGAAQANENPLSFQRIRGQVSDQGLQTQQPLPPPPS